MSEHSAENDVGLTDAELDQVNDAFVEANRAEFLDTDFDLPIQRAIESILIERMRMAWHEGYGAGSSNATDGWLDHRSSVTRNPYTRPIPPEPGELRRRVVLDVDKHDLDDLIRYLEGDHRMGVYDRSKIVAQLRKQTRPIPPEGQ